MKDVVVGQSNTCTGFLRDRGLQFLRVKDRFEQVFIPNANPYTKIKQARHHFNALLFF